MTHRLEVLADQMREGGFTEEEIEAALFAVDGNGAIITIPMGSNPTVNLVEGIGHVIEYEGDRTPEVLKPPGYVAMAADNKRLRAALQEIATMRTQSWNKWWKATEVATLALKREKPG